MNIFGTFFIINLFELYIYLYFFFHAGLQAEWIISDTRPPDDWPEQGNIAVEEFDLKYREGLPLVLKNINCNIKPGEKVC